MCIYIDTNAHVYVYIILYIYTYLHLYRNIDITDICIYIHIHTELCRSVFHMSLFVRDGRLKLCWAADCVQLNPRSVESAVLEVMEEARWPRLNVGVAPP